VPECGFVETCVGAPIPFTVDPGRAERAWVDGKRDGSWGSGGLLTSSSECAATRLDQHSPQHGSLVVIPPVQREHSDSAQARLDCDAHQLITSGMQEPSEVSPSGPFPKADVPTVALSRCMRIFRSRSMSDLTPTLPVAGNLGLPWLMFLTVLAASCVGPGGRRRFRWRP
jgi:hypothetical protein